MSNCIPTTQHKKEKEEEVEKDNLHINGKVSTLVHKVEELHSDV